MTVCSHCGFGRGRYVSVLDRQTRRKKSILLCDGCQTRPNRTWRLRYEEVSR